MELAKEAEEDDRKRLHSKEARLAELMADSQDKHQSITLYVLASGPCIASWGVPLLLHMGHIIRSDLTHLFSA